MQKIQLTLSQAFTPEQEKEIFQSLSVILPTEEPRIYFKKSFNVPSEIIQLIGNVAVWVSLAGGAAFLAGFFNTLGKKTGELTWEKILAKFSKDKENELVILLAQRLSEAAKKKAGNVQIIVGLDIPDDFWGTALIISNKEPLDILFELSHFLNKVEDLAQKMQTEMDKGNQPLGRALIEIQKDGSLKVSWQNKDFEQKELII